MLSGGQALETYATRRASSVLQALARRMPAQAHRVEGGTFRDVGAVAAAGKGELVVHILLGKAHGLGTEIGLRIDVL